MKMFRNGLIMIWVIGAAITVYQGKTDEATFAMLCAIFIQLDGLKAK